MKKTILSLVVSFILLFVSSTVMAQTPNDVGVDSILTPIGACDGYQDSVRVRVQNYGANQVDSFMLHWDIDGITGSQWVNSILGTTTGSNTVDIGIDTFLMSPGVFNIDTWTSLPNNQTDSDILNDSASFNDSIEVFYVEFTFCTSGDTFYFMNLSTGSDAFLWDFGDGTTSNDVNPTHVYPQGGIITSGFTVTLTGFNCSGDQEFLIDTIGFGSWPYTGQNPCTLVNGITENYEPAEVALFPNPSDGIFTLNVNLTNSSNVFMEVLDVRGEVVKTKEFGFVANSLSQEINLNDTAPGIYFVKVQVVNTISVHKIVIE